MNVVFGSIDQMLSPAGLSGLVGAALDSIERTPLIADHYSGNLLERINCRCEGRPMSFVLKRFRRDRDWVMRLTRDTQVREIALYRMGVYANLPEPVWHPMLAVAPEADSWAALMEDVSPWLANKDSVDEAGIRRFIQHLAAVHARFINDSELEDPRLGLSSLHSFVDILSPRTAAAEIDQGRSEPVLRAAVEGWAAFERLAAPEVVAVVRALQNDSDPIVDAMTGMPQTLVHGDFKLANLGCLPAQPEPRTILLDWQDATRGPPLLDLAYWLAVNPDSFPGARKERAILDYRAALAGCGVTFSEAEWDKQLPICLVAGGGLRLLWQLALRHARGDKTGQDLEWWSEKVLMAGRELS